MKFPGKANASNAAWVHGPDGTGIHSVLRAVLTAAAVAVLLIPMGAALVYLPWLPFAIIAGALLLLLIAVRLDIGLGLTLASLALGVCGDLDEDGTISVTKLLLMAVAALWLARMLVTKDIRLVKILSRNVSTLFLWGFLFWAFVSCVWSVSWVGSIMALIRVVSLAGMYVVIMAIVKNRRAMILVLTFSLVAGFLVCSGGIYEMVTQQSVQKFFGRSRSITVSTSGGSKLSSRKYGEYTTTAAAKISAETQGSWERVLATFGSENEYAVYICGLLGPAIAFWFVARRRLLKWMLAGVILVIVINIIGTGSRGGLLSLMMLFFVYLLCARFPLKWPIVTAMVPLAGAALFLLPAVFEQFRSGFTMEAITTDPRWYLYQMELAMFADHPLTGVGFGCFYLHYPYYHIPGSPFWALVGHNVPLQMLAEGGPVESMLWMAFCSSVIISLIRTVKISRDPVAWHLSVGLLSSLCAYALNSLMENSLGHSHFWACMGLGLAWAAVVHEEQRAELGERRPWLLAAGPRQRVAAAAT